MNQNPTDQTTCEVCHKPFNSEEELQTHQDNAHGQGESGGKQSNYDIETDRPNERKIA
jgi:C2H2-type zinc finger protein